MISLPIHAVLPRLREALYSHRRVILQADPGAGKSTVVPLELMEEPWLSGRRILMLEPRRLAARMVATRMAETLGERPGERVGYRMRGEAQVSRRTRIEVVTEGILTRMLQSDPGLEEVGLLIFDEFHERSLHADLGLALALQSQELLREDLRILVMSATLQSDELLGLLGEETPLIQSAGRSHPVTLHYRDPRAPVVTPDNLAAETARTVKEALQRHEGSLLAFLPGLREIRQCARLLEGLGPEVEVLELYGALDPAAQRRVIRPAPPGRRKVILATNLAETSLTIDGIRIVVDGGYRREVSYDAAVGMERMQTRPIAADSARQRAGRAGRTAPGVCYRLWHEHRALAPRSTPEILQADLAPLALELARWGAAPEELGWIDPPPRQAMEEASRLLRELEMLDERGALTPLGERALTLGEHPRIAHMLLRATEMELGYEGVLLTLLLTERPPITRSDDLAEEMEELHRLLSGSSTPPTLRQRFRTLLRQSGTEAQTVVRSDRAGLLTALAYPERVARQRGDDGAYLAASGRGITLPPRSALARHPLLAVAESSGEGMTRRIRRAAPLSPVDLCSAYPHALQRHRELRYNETTGRVEAREELRFHRLILEQHPLPRPEGEEVSQLLLEGIRQRGVESLPWSSAASALRERLLAAHRHRPEIFSDWSDEALLESLEEWLLPWIEGMNGLEDLKSLDLKNIMLGSLSWEERQSLDRLFPATIELPTGTRAVVNYADPEAPVLAARLQELFGWRETPRILEGQLPLALQLLSPARRPLALTRDLENFWRRVYPEVRKEMRGRYPKHYWPEDPFSATPTRRTKKGMARP